MKNTKSSTSVSRGDLTINRFLSPFLRASGAANVNTKFHIEMILGSGWRQSTKKKKCQW